MRHIHLDRIVTAITMGRVNPLGRFNMKTTRYCAVIAILTLLFWAGHGALGQSSPVQEGVTSPASETAAMLLPQHPDMKRILIVGQGQSLADVLLRVESLEAVDWIALKSEDTSQAESEDRLHPVTEAGETWLARHPEFYDAVIVNLPDPGHPWLAFWTTEASFERIEEALTFNGILAVGLPAERPYWAAVVQQTMMSVMRQTLLVGDRRVWFLGAKYIHLETVARRLRLRFESLNQANGICDPNILDVIYDYQRSRERQDRLAQAPFPVTLINRDPQQTRWQAQQLQWWRRCGDRNWGVLQGVQRLGAGVILAAVALALWLCRAVVRIKERRKRGSWALEVGPFDRRVLPLAGGIVAGLFLAHHLSASGAGRIAGLLALFALGLGLGMPIAHGLGARCQGRPLSLWGLTVVAVLVQGLCLALTQGRHALGEMLLSGLFMGGYLILSPLEVGESPGRRTVGNWGIPVGLTIGTFLTPAVVVVSWGVLATVLGMRVLLLIPVRQSVGSSWRRTLGLTLAIVGLTVLLATHYYLRWTQQAPADDGLAIAVRALVPEGHLLARQVDLSDAQDLDYWEVTQGQQVLGYVFASRDLCEPVYGYGGEMELLAYVDPAGRLLDYRLTRQNETPRFLQWIAPWMEALKGKTVFGDAALADVDTVSGATFSTRAIRSLLSQTGPRFAREVLQWREGASTAVVSPWCRVITDTRVLALLAALVLALVVMRWDLHRLRMVWLALIVAVMGLWLNVQVSTDHIMPLLHGDWPVWQQGISWLLVLGVPLVILLFGNVYCGYLCPFGALQELLSLIIPRRWQPGRNAQRWAGLIKYFILTTWAVTYLLREDKAVYTQDPLLSFFSTPLSETLLSPWAGLLLVAVLVFPRFWCRTLCPTGAFLSLFNLGVWLGRWLPVKKYGQCEFGLTGRDHLDCIHCDRCRHPQTAVTPPLKNKWPDRIYLGLAMVLAIWLLCL